MRRLVAFNNISLDGYFSGPGGDLSWASNRRTDPEYGAFVAENAQGGGVLVLGRVTYDMMAGFWPTPIAAQVEPVVAERMNNLEKLVFSRTMTAASWNNTRLVRDGLADEIRRLKAEPGPDLAILGSGSVVAQLAQVNLIDEYQLVVVPVILGSGRTMFEGVAGAPELRLVKSRVFANGNVFLSYEPVV